MNPFPSTPTPRRFLLPGRATQSSSQTPGAAPPPRFQSTPRFGSSSAARPTQRRELDIEESDEQDDDDDKSDEEEVVYESSLSGDERGAAAASSRQRVLEIESDAGVVSSQQDALSDGEDGDGRLRTRLRFDIEEESVGERSWEAEMGRGAKRRKVSISPSPLLGSPGTRDAEEEEEEEEPALGLLHDETDADPEEDGAASVMSMDSSEGSPITMRNSKAPRQPIFQPAPRFKPLDAEDILSGGLPAVFSPQKRGA
ncbi:hypothetical protein BBK36DRAFT_1090855, partial [Trichoderma citrinoviride]